MIRLKISSGNNFPRQVIQESTLFHAWRLFHFDESTETLDSYVTHLRQVATLLCYGEPQVFGVFNNTLPTRLYWVLFPMGDLRQVVEPAERILTKEKIDIQLPRQTSSMPFMNMKDGYISKKVTLDTLGSLDEKMYRITSMMSKLTAQNDDQIKQCKPKIYQSKRRGQTRNFYDCSYGQRNYQNRYRSNNGDRKISFSGRIQYGQNKRQIKV